MTSVTRRALLWRWLKRSLLLGFVVLLFFGGYKLYHRPTDQGGDYPPRFAALNQALRGAQVAEPVMVIDLDVLDANLDRLKGQLDAGRHFRLVVKSLPSVELLRYAMARMDTRRLMVFHVAHVDILMAGLGDDLDIFMGKPVAASAAGKVAHLAQVQWLVDSADRLGEFLALAKARGQRLKVAVELDVGMHRGGVRSEVELEPMLALLEANPTLLELTGFMGYDGHVPYSLFSWGDPLPGVKRALEATLARNEAFLQYVTQRHPALVRGRELTFNSGGTRTYTFYQGRKTVVNDLAVGSGLLMPADFQEPWLEGLEPALFMALPVLKRLETPSLPLLDRYWDWLSWWDPNLQVGYYLYGGYCGACVAPEGLQPGPFSDGSNTNFLPSQSHWTGSRRIPSRIGDFIFVRPCEADTLVAFRTLYTVRANQLRDIWHPLPFLN